MIAGLCLNDTVSKGSFHELWLLTQTGRAVMFCFADLMQLANVCMCCSLEEATAPAVIGELCLAQGLIMSVSFGSAIPVWYWSAADRSAEKLPQRSSTSE